MKVGDQAPLLPLFLSLLVASNSFNGTAASFMNHLSESDNCPGVECDVIHSTLPSKAVMLFLQVIQHLHLPHFKI